MPGLVAIDPVFDGEPATASARVDETNIAFGLEMVLPKRMFARSSLLKASRGNLQAKLTPTMPYVAVLVGCASWHQNGYFLAMTASVAVAIFMVATVMQKNAAIVLTVIGFGVIGIARAQALMDSEPVIKLLRSSSSGETVQHVTIVLSGERGLLAITGPLGRSRSLNFIPWDQIKQIRRQHPATVGTTLDRWLRYVLPH